MKLPARSQDRLRSLFAGRACIAANRDGREVLRNVLMVGATLDQDRQLSDADQLHLSACLNDLSDSSLGLSPEFETSIVNLDTRYGGEDFLRDPARHKPDLVLLCYIFNGSVLASLMSPVAYMSGRHAAPRIWPESVAKSGTR